ncbi:DUF4062 domain-containing protein [Leifsonia xyli]|uniref:DUF4062 domain-containing protein n=1 Tax=Leifsonia xyli TaxID=1575 RepID=UPI003D6648E4
MNAGPPVIRTPDQRLRVFVSSTLKELAAERRAARAAIERLHLAPVMFELGARPHPPRELYRAYLDQSDVFVGLYWERYGWVAPGEQVSGLEDEYNLCPPDLPRLIYIKDPAPGREPRLTELLARIREDDHASFTYIESAEGLQVLLEADLAVLLAERFELSRVAASPGGSAQATQRDAPAATVASLPSPLTRLIGREDDVAAVRRILADGARLLTLTGPGGIGKSRLAIAAAAGMTEPFPDGAVFVDVSPVHDAAGLTAALAGALGVRDTGDAPLADKVTTALRDRRMLLLLDNFEQALSAAPAVTSLLATAPGVSALVTSRSLLRVGVSAATTWARCRPIRRPRCSSSAPMRSGPTLSSRLRMRTLWPGSAPPSTVCRSRSSWRPRASGCSRPASSRGDWTGASPPRRRRSRPPGAAAHPARDDRVEHAAADRPRAPPALAAGRLRGQLQPGGGGARGRRHRSGRPGRSG